MPAKPGPLRPHEARDSYARRQPVTQPPGEPDFGDSFLIVTEGEVTEKRYFESVRAALQLSTVTVKLVHPEYTDAIGLVRAAMDLYERDSYGKRRAKSSGGIRDVQEWDHVWVLFDTDVPDRQGQLGPALELAAREGIHVGHSTPSVEIWLLLHFRDRPGFLTSQAAERAVAEAWGQVYDKSRHTFDRLWPVLKSNISTAVSRAEQTRRYHQHSQAKFPANPSTELDLLVRALNASVQPSLRILR